MLRRNKDIDQLIHHISILVFMLHGEEIHLIFHRVIQHRRLNLQGIIHEHLVIFSVSTLIFRDHELILIFSEIESADDPIQLISSLVRLQNCTSDLKDEIIFKMFHCLARLLFCGLTVGFQIIAFQICKQVIVRSIVPQ